MLFTTAAFLLLFLPVTLAGFFVLGRRSHSAAAAWLFLASLLFYGYWMPAFTLLLLASIAVNFLVGGHVARQVRSGRAPVGRRWLVAGLVFNLSLLGYFKYANFFIDNLNAVLGTDWSWGRVILPIGISFYTFTQIAYLVDAYEGKVEETNPVHYGLFVTYFPHLIAGPVLHHAQMMPQFADPAIYRPQAARLIGGMAIFLIGMFKKVVLADGMSPYADAVFRPVDGGAMPLGSEAWLGAWAYTLQIYFDFSGYSDMAIGLSWLFNVKLPFNFDSPYQARSISDFWRRWHISLSNFLRDYLYIPLGGNRFGSLRRYGNLAATMLLGGLWHGAGWTFVIWGALHGLYLTVNHAFRGWLGERRHGWLQDRAAYRVGSWALTLLAVVFAWVFFRAETLSGAIRMVQAMFGLGASGAEASLLWQAGLPLTTGMLWGTVLSGVALFAPNSNRIGQHLMRELEAPASWRPMLAGGVVAATAMLLLVNVARDSVSAFIYFNF
jgi:alginate O-acetyltransferase complex protein AlgI